MFLASHEASIQHSEAHHNLMHNRQAQKHCLQMPEWLKRETAVWRLDRCEMYFNSTRHSKKMVS